VWNFLDVLLPIFVGVSTGFQMAEWYDLEYQKPEFIVTVHSVCSLMIWIKFLYFLRIFTQTGYLINMLNQVIYDMKVFLLILMIIYLGFGEAFLRLSQGS
jgi:hypothetical protein